MISNRSALRDDCGPPASKDCGKSQKLEGPTLALSLSNLQHCGLRRRAQRDTAVEPRNREWSRNGTSREGNGTAATALIATTKTLSRYDVILRSFAKAWVLIVRTRRLIYFVRTPRATPTPSSARPTNGLQPHHSGSCSRLCSLQPLPPGSGFREVARGFLFGAAKTAVVGSGHERRLEIKPRLKYKFTVHKETDDDH